MNSVEASCQYSDDAERVCFFLAKCVLSQLQTPETIVWFILKPPSPMNDVRSLGHSCRLLADHQAMIRYLSITSATSRWLWVHELEVRPGRLMVTRPAHDVLET